MLIGDLLQRRARISPETVYWEGEAGRCTYAQLNGAANRLAHALRAEGWVPGTIVGIHADGGLPYAVVHFAAAKAGLVLAHLNPRYTPTELAWAANHCGCRALFFGADQMASAAEARAESPGVKHWIALDGDDLPDWAVALEGWSAGRPESDPAPPDWVKESSPFQLLYTSGTTGYPKGALMLPAGVPLEFNIWHESSASPSQRLVLDVSRPAFTTLDWTKKRRGRFRIELQPGQTVDFGTIEVPITALKP